MKNVGIAIVDSGSGNIGSIVNMLKHIGYTARTITTPQEVLNSGKLILPGVGHWDNAAARLEASGLREALVEVAALGTPLLGICLGMQMLFSESEEGKREGLGLIPGRIKRFDFYDRSAPIADGERKLRVPHMGWNTVRCRDQSNPILVGLEVEASFYFVHSFHASDVPKDLQLLTCHYGYEFVCGVNQRNVWGFQFHPEKSHKFGMQLLTNFAGMK